MKPTFLDEWKVLPRIAFFAQIVLSWKVVIWYMDLADPSVQQSGLVSVVMGAMTGSFAVWMGKEAKTTVSHARDVETSVETR